MGKTTLNLVMEGMIMKALRRQEEMIQKNQTLTQNLKRSLILMPTKTWKNKAWIGTRWRKKQQLMTDASVKVVVTIMIQRRENGREVGKVEDARAVEEGEVVVEDLGKVVGDEG